MKINSNMSFSIVIINYNYDIYLKQAIESALNQSYGRCEVIVVDDKSTDASRKIMKSYGERIQAVYRETNGGMSAAANSGFNRTSGDVVLFLDADDYLYPNAAETMLEAWSEGTAQIQARLHLVNAKGEIEDIFPPRELNLDEGSVASTLGSRGRYSTTVTSGLAFSRAALDAVMPIPEVAFNRSADGYLAAVVPFYGTVTAINVPLGAYRRHDSNHSGFQANIAKRARWRIDHDEHRYAAMRRHAANVGASIAASPGMQDGTHLEQRLASLLFDPEHHPYPADDRLTLAFAGARAALSAPMSPKRRGIYSAMFVVAGVFPLFISRRALAWKLERSSRPAIIDRAAGLLRRISG